MGGAVSSETNLQGRSTWARFASGVHGDALAWHFFCLLGMELEAAELIGPGYDFYAQHCKVNERKICRKLVAKRELPCVRQNGRKNPETYNSLLKKCGRRGWFAWL